MLGTIWLFGLRITGTLAAVHPLRNGAFKYTQRFVVICVLNNERRISLIDLNSILPPSLLPSFVSSQTNQRLPINLNPVPNMGQKAEIFFSCDISTWPKKMGRFPDFLPGANFL